MQNYLQSSFDFKELPIMFDELPLWSAPFGLKLLDAVKYKVGITALDIGFGTGFPLTELAMRLGNTTTVYGIDPWKEAIERARQKIAYYRIDNIKLIEGVAESIPLPHCSVDLIVSNNGLNNVADLLKVVSECSRICKPGAQFVQTMNLNKSMIEFYDVFEEVLAKKQMNEEIDKMHAHIYSKRKPLDEIVEILEQKGFSVVEALEDSFKYRFTDATAMFNHYFIRLAFMESWIQLLPPEKVSEVFEEVEQILNGKAAFAGQMVLTVPFVMINAVKN